MLVGQTVTIRIQERKEPGRGRGRQELGPSLRLDQVPQHITTLCRWVLTFIPLSQSFPYIERKALQVRARVMQAQVSAARFDPWRALGTWNTLLHPFPGFPERPNG